MYSLSAHIAEMLQETYPGRPLPKSKEDIEAYLGPLPTDRELTEIEKHYRTIDEFAINQMLKGDSVTVENVLEQVRRISKENDEREEKEKLAREQAEEQAKEQSSRQEDEAPSKEPEVEIKVEPAVVPVEASVAVPVAMPAAAPMPEAELPDPLVLDQVDAEAEFRQFIEQLEQDNLPEWRARRRGRVVTPAIAEAAREAIQVHCRNLRNLYDSMFERMAAQQEQMHPPRDEGFDTSDDEGEDGEELVDNFNLEELVDDDHVAAFHRLVYEMAYGNGNEDSDEEDDAE